MDNIKECRLDKLQNFLIDRLAALGIGESETHDVAGESVHFAEDGFDLSMLGDGFSSQSACSSDKARLTVFAFTLVDEVKRVPGWPAGRR